MLWKLTFAVLIATGFSGGHLSLFAATINVPNNSFEIPTTTYVGINFDSWQKVPKPPWYVENGGFLWSQLIGAFKNTAPTSFDHIDNCDGNQALWLFVVPEVAMFQDYNSVDWNDSAPTHAFDAKFEVGKSYQLTVGIIGGGGGMLEGASLELSLYYRDTVSNKVIVASTGVTNNLTDFPNKTHLFDRNVNVSTVRAGDAWTGQNIGIQILSTVSTELQGGYWDLDNVRLTSQVEPVLRNPAQTNGQFSFTLLSEPGSKFEILSSTNLDLAISNWTSLAILTNDSGAILFEDGVTNNASLRFYRGLQQP